MRTSTIVMRIVQEALTNVVRHSGATEVSVSLCNAEGSILIEIWDNGCGVTKEQLSSLTAYGLMGMAERARMCKGELEIIGSPGCGTRLTLKIPTPEEN